MPVVGSMLEKLVSLALVISKGRARLAARQKHLQIRTSPIGKAIDMPVAKIEYEGVTFEVEVTPQALDDIRFKFNPSNTDKVTRLKTLAAAYLSLLEAVCAEGNNIAGREFAIARTDFQKVSMMAVLGATKGL